MVKWTALPQHSLLLTPFIKMYFNYTHTLEDLFRLTSTGSKTFAIQEEYCRQRCSRTHSDFHYKKKRLHPDVFNVICFPQVSWSSECSCPPCWTPENSGRLTVTTAAPWAWNTASASAVTPTTLGPFATSSAEPETTSSATSTATLAAPKYAWKDGLDQSAKKVACRIRDLKCWINHL